MFLKNNTIASRIPAARPEGSPFAVSGFLSLCVRLLDEEKTHKKKSFNPRERSYKPYSPSIRERGPTNPTVLQFTGQVVQTLQSFNPREGSGKPYSPSILERVRTNPTVLQCTKVVVQTLKSFNPREEFYTPYNPSMHERSYRSPRCRPRVGVRRGRHKNIQCISLVFFV